MPESERRALPLGWIVATAATMLLVGAIVVGIIAYRQFFNTPSGMFRMVIVPIPFGNILFERDGVSFEPTPKFSERGIEDIQKNVEKLMKSPKLSLSIYTDKNQSTGFTLATADSGIRARFMLDSALQPGVEEKLRSLFEEPGEKPARVESDGSGFTLIEYSVEGSPETVSRVIGRVLVDAYGMAPDAGLYFQFDEE